MDRTIDVALITALILLLLVKVLAVAPEIGIPLVMAGAIANGWRNHRAGRQPRQIQE